VSLNLTKPQGSTVDSPDDGDGATLPATTFTRFSRNQQERCPDVTLPAMNNSAACGLPLLLNRPAPEAGSVEHVKVAQVG
jgi:hypothetical protein